MGYVIKIILININTKKKNIIFLKILQLTYIIIGYGGRSYLNFLVDLMFSSNIINYSQYYLNKHIIVKKIYIKLSLWAFGAWK